MQEQVSDPLVGTLVDNRYLVRPAGPRRNVHRLSRHGPAARTRVALKVLHPHLADDPTVPGPPGPRSQGRGQTLPPARGGRPRPGQDGRLAYLVMEYIKGHTLRDVLNDKGALSPAAGPWP